MNQPSIVKNKLTKIYVGGRWIESTSQSLIPVINPATEEEIGVVTEGSVEDANKAVAAAREAFSSWSTTSPGERGKFITRMSQALERRSDELAATISSELGFPLHLCARSQVNAPIARLESYEELATIIRWEEPLSATTTVVRAPVGVVVAITPWNFPLGQAIDKIGAALLAGCTVILKPSEITPRSTLAFAEAADEAGIPPGVFNLVNGTGPVIGEALVRHPDVDMVSFTGSTRSGKRIAALTSERVARVALELGGKSAAILLDDADLEAAVPSVLNWCYLNSGQVCVSLSRLLAPRSRYEEIVSRVKAAAEGYAVGDPNTHVRLGPLVSGVQRDRVRHYIETGIKEGARLVTGGSEPPAGLDKGYYVAPTVFADVESSMTIAQEEIFGPVLSIMAYDDDDEDAVRIANDTSYGLSGAVWSADIARANRIARQLRTGMVIVNGAGDVGAPFGGFKQSGIGREGGRFGVEEFLEVQTIFSP